MNPDQRVLRRVAADPLLAPLAMAGSPMAQALKAELLAADGETGRVEVSFEPGPMFTQAAGVVQGGAVAAMLDFVLAYAALLAVPEGMSVASATLQVSFLRPAPKGAMRAVGRVERAGRTLVFTAAQLFDASGHQVASGHSALPVVQWRADAT